MSYGQPAWARSSGGGGGNTEPLTIVISVPGQLIPVYDQLLINSFVVVTLNSLEPILAAAAYVPSPATNLTINIPALEVI